MGIQATPQVTVGGGIVVNQDEDLNTATPKSASHPMLSAKADVIIAPAQNAEGTPSSGFSGRVGPVYFLMPNSNLNLHRGGGEAGIAVRVPETPLEINLNALVVRNFTWGMNEVGADLSVNLCYNDTLSFGGYVGTLGGIGAVNQSPLFFGLQTRANF